MPTYYGILKGRTVGVTKKMKVLQNSIKDYPDAQWESFGSKEEAERYIAAHQKGKAASTAAKSPVSNANTVIAEKPKTRKQTPKQTTLPKEKSPTPKTIKSEETTSSHRKTETPAEIIPVPNVIYHPVKREAKGRPEPAFSHFLDNIEAPELPPLADPELFEAVFFQNFSSSEFKFMPHYGDALLKAMTYDVLSELLGKDNFKTISNITPLAISNAFYEEIVLHYGLEKLTSCNGSSSETPSRGTTHRRGDLLEAYMAAIEKDISRDGQGYREVRDWLFKVLALRLGRPAVQDGTSVCSNGTERQSFTLLPSPSAGTSITHPGVGVPDFNISTLKSVPLLSPTRGRKAISPSSQAVDIWWHQGRQTTAGMTMEGNQFPLTNSPLKEDRSALNGHLDHFRRFIFELMKEILRLSSTTGSWNVEAFWTTMSRQLSQMQSMLQDESEKILLFYYRSYVYLQLNDIPLAIEALFSLLSLPSHFFQLRLHERAVKRLLSIESETSITIIAYDIHCEAGVACFGDEHIVEWNSRKVVRPGQEMDVYLPGSDGEMENSNDVYEEVYLEPMDID